MSSFDLQAQCPCPSNVTFFGGAGNGAPTVSGIFPFGSFTSNTICISGNLTVDKNFSFRKVIFSTANSSITVQSGFTLTIDAGDSYEPCDNSFRWLQILVQPGATVISGNNALIKGSQNGIVLQGDNGVSSIIDTRFQNNSRSIMLGGNQGSTTKIKGNTITGSGAITSTGIFAGPSNVTTAPFLVSIGNNTISSVGTGIAANKCKFLTIDGLDQGSIVSSNNGISMIGSTDCVVRNNPQINAPRNGILAFQSMGNLVISNNKMLNGSGEGTGIQIELHHVDAGTIDVLGNLVQEGAFWRTGIRLRNISGTSTATLAGNKILDPLNFGIDAERITLNLSMNTNYIRSKVHGAILPVGIRLDESTFESKLFDNTIETIEISEINYAIGVFDCKNVQVVSNKIRGVNPVPLPGGLEQLTIGFGINVHNSTNTLLCCNDLNHAVRGTNFAGSCPSTRNSGTTFRNHKQALFYDFATTDDQDWRGNDWQNVKLPIGGWDAYHNGFPIQVTASEYRMSPYLINSTLSRVFPEGWFYLIPGGDMLCNKPTQPSGNSFCGDDPYFGAGSNPTLSSSDKTYLTTSQPNTPANVIWEAKRSIWTRLQAAPSLANSDPAFSSFYAAAPNSLVDKMEQIETGLRSLGTPSTALRADLQASLLQMRQKRSELEAVMAQLAQDPTSQSLLNQHSNLIGQLEALAVQHDVLLGQKEAECQAQLAGLVTMNNNLSTATTFQATEKAMNALLLSQIFNDEWAFSSPERAQIDAAALGCPLLDGRGVLKARSMQSAYQISQWNDVGCSTAVSFYSNGKSSISNTLDWSILPNPAAESFAVRFEKASERPIFVKIRDVSGRLVEQSILSIGQTELILPSERLPDGIYFVRVWDNAELNSVRKLIVSH